MDTTPAPYNPPIVQNTNYRYQTISQKQAIFNRYRNLINVVMLIFWTGCVFYAGSKIGSATPTHLAQGRLESNTTWRLKRLLPGMIANPGPGCKISGCGNGQCISTTSPDLAPAFCAPSQFACFTQAICEIQPNGLCDWTETPEFQTCQEKNEGMGDNAIDLNQDVDEILNSK